MKHIRALGFALGLLPAIAAAQVQNYPQTLPPNTVVGRLGNGAGPSQPIPFTTLRPLLGTMSGPTTTTVGHLATWANSTGSILADFSGTSGGVPYFKTDGGINSSALLTQYGPLIGGGANAGPSAVAVGTNNQAFMGTTGGAPSFRALVGADLPNPGASSLGGVQSKTCTASQWVSQLTTGGVLNCSQPAFSDISGRATLSQIPQSGAATILGNPTGSTADVTAFTIQGLTARGSPDATNDKIPIYDNAAGTIKYVTPTQVASAGVAGVSSIAGNTGAFTLSTGITNSTNDIRVDKATNANYYAGTSNKVPTTDVIYPPNVTITYGATTSIDFSTFNNGTITLTGNITTMNVSNVVAGKSGRIRFIQDGTGSRTTVWSSTFKFAGGTTPTLTTAASAIDVLYYDCETSPATVCYASLNKDMK